MWTGVLPTYRYCHLEVLRVRAHLGLGWPSLGNHYGLRVQSLLQRGVKNFSDLEVFGASTKSITLRELGIT